MKPTAALTLLALALAIPSRAFSAPLYDITTLGLQGVEHTRNDGYLFSAAQEMNAAGQVVGYAERYIGGSTYLGESLWMYDGSTTHQIGLVDAEHTRNDGYKQSSIAERVLYLMPFPLPDLPAVLVNEAGFVAGHSERFNGGSSLGGQSAWLFNGSTTEKTGLTDSEHTGPNGSKESTVVLINGRGRGAGHSRRYRATDTRGPTKGTSAWYYDGATTLNIGLIGAEHTRDDDFRESSVRGISDLGHVAGFSFRYNGGNTSLGGSAWLYDGVSTQNIGLVDAEHTSSGGNRYSFVWSQFETGHVLGLASRYNGGSSDLGQTIWLYDGSATSNIGLVGSEHTRNDGYKTSAIYRYTTSGHVTGYAKRYNGGATDLGDSVWIYHGSTTNQIGLTDVEHTRNDGYMTSSFAVVETVETNDPLFTESGFVAGYSNRYNGGSIQLGKSAWLYNGITSVHIGLIGTEHTRDDGYRSIASHDINEAGQVIGTAVRYNGGTPELGRSAWLYNGTTTLNIGLTDAEHARDDGYKYSYAKKVSNLGHVVGSSTRYNGGTTTLGASAWLYNGDSTLNIGLVGPDYTRSDDSRHSIPYMNEAGHVVGYSYRYSSGENEFSDFGLTTWVHDGGATKVIGLTDAAHTRDDGLQFSRMGPQNLVDDPWFNSTGQVIGISARYLGGSTQNGASGWFYDPQLDETIPLILSTRSDGFAYSFPDYLGEDGLVLGTYTLFDELDNNLGDRLFYFTLDEGLHDLGALVNGGLAANGWEQLASWLRVNRTDHILGHGLLTSQTAGQMPYLLTLQKLAGDYNNDGSVNAADYTVWRNNLGAPAGTLPNDVDGGLISHAQYETWRAHYGETLAIGSSESNSQAAVPEPNSSLLLMVIFVLACAKRRLGCRRRTAFLSPSRGQPEDIGTVPLCFGGLRISGRSRAVFCPPEPTNVPS